LWLIQRTYRRYFYTTWKGSPSSQMWFFVQLCSSWQDFNWFKASRGPSAIAELLVKIFALLESAWNLLQNARNIIYLILGMLLHDLGEFKNSNCLQMWKKTQTNCILIVFNFDIHPQILIFSVFNIAILSPYWLQIKFSTVLLLIYVCDQFVVLEIRHSSRHCSVCQLSTWYSATTTRFWQKLCIWRGAQQRSWQTNFPRKAGQSVALVSCWKSCGIQAQLTGGQSAADRAVPPLKKTLRQLMVLSQEDKLQIHRTVSEISRETGTHRCTQHAICLHVLPYLLNICRKFEFLTSKCSIASCLRWIG